MAIARTSFWIALFPALFLSASQSYMAAQTTPDFSGVFLRTAMTANPGISQIDSSHEVAPLILEVSQSGPTLSVTARLNGETRTDRYDLNAALQSNGDIVKIKDKNLIVELHANSKSRDTRVPTTRLGLVLSEYPMGVRAIEKWELSKDLQTLTIWRKIEPLDKRNSRPELVYEYKEAFTRQPTLTNASSVASQIEGGCSSLPPPPATNKNVRINYEEGVVFGSSQFQQIGRCLSFSATLSAKHLERVFTSHGNQFLLDSKPVNTLPDVITLEIATSTICATGWRDETVKPTKAFDLNDFNFQVKWRGLGVIDLGTVDAKLLQEPWPELGTPQWFFRLKIPTKGTSFDDSLEVRISDQDGQQLACIAGHV